MHQVTNSATTYAHNNSLSLIFPKLNMAHLHVLGYSDALFANNSGLSSHLGYIVFLVDNTINFIPLIFLFYKSRRICRSSMPSEVIPFSDMFYASYTLTGELSTSTQHQLPLRLLTDNKSLFDSISKGSRTSEKRLMLDTAAAREGYRISAVSDIGLVPSEGNLADGLTKPMSQAALLSVISSGHHTPNPSQWILRPKEPEV